MKKNSLFLVLCLSTILTNVSSNNQKSEKIPHFALAKHRRPLTLREKIAQLFVVGAFPSPTPEYHEALRSLIENECIGD